MVRIGRYVWLMVGVLFLGLVIVVALVVLKSSTSLNTLLVRTAPVVGKVITSGELEVESKDPNFKIRVGDKRVLLKIAQNAGIFRAGGIGFPFHENTEINSISVTLATEDDYLNHPAFEGGKLDALQARLESNKESGKNPVIASLFGIKDEGGVLGFLFVIDRDLQKELNWSDEMLSEFVSTEVAFAIDFNLSQWMKGDSSLTRDFYANQMRERRGVSDLPILISSL